MRQIDESGAPLRRLVRQNKPQKTRLTIWDTVQNSRFIVLGSSTVEEVPFIYVRYMFSANQQGNQINLN